MINNNASMFKHVTNFGASYVESKYTSTEKGFLC